ncbi:MULTISPECIES: hypothetical protein [unclassified Burkholderia]|uniref:hypothetical protein n=1 Tax=unclassified Burkholderia TaxID=2613784 RepID=UPI001E3BE8C8|nr:MULTISPECIES: hypothetical protein [unclassified Burkholderia]
MAVARKRPPGKAIKILSGFSLTRHSVNRAVPADFGGDVRRRKVFQRRNADAAVRHFSCGIRFFRLARGDIARRRDLHRLAFLSINGSATTSCKQERRPNESIKEFDVFKQNA